MKDLRVLFCWDRMNFIHLNFKRMKLKPLKFIYMKFIISMEVSEMNFIGREKETAQIMEALQSDGQELILIYGRRHIGKTELVKHCLQGYHGKSVYYMCRQVNEKLQTAGLTSAVSIVNDLHGMYFRSFEACLKYLFESAENEPLVIVLDEYPYARKMIEGLDSIIQALFDEYKFRSKIKLILSGSYIDTMKEIADQSQPLNGRITLQIDLKEMNYFESAKFYPDFRNDEKVQLFSVFGGVPLYNSMIRKDLSVKENIIRLIASPNGRLVNEVNTLISAELSKLENAAGVFSAIAEGARTYSEIQDESGITSTASLSSTLKKLMGMELVKKIYPINKENDKTKTRYEISDHLSLFYYKYIAGNISSMTIMDSEAFYERFIAEDFYERYVPRVFEEVCAQFLIRKNRQGNIDPVFTEIGKYYYDNPSERKNGEFDIVTNDENGYIFYEAKFKSMPVSYGMIQKEIKQVNATTLHSYRYGFFSKSGFKDDIPKEIICYTLDDLFNT